jgi:hypothetical protein
LDEAVKQTITIGLPGHKFSEGSFDGNIGKPIKVYAPEGYLEGVIVDAKIIDDGDRVEITIDIGLSGANELENWVENYGNPNPDHGISRLDGSAEDPIVPGQA